MPHSFTTPWTVARQAPLSMGFPRQEYWSGLPFPSPGDLPDPWTKPKSPTVVGGFFTPELSGKPTRWSKPEYLHEPHSKNSINTWLCNG